MPSQHRGELLPAHRRRNRDPLRRAALPEQPHRGRRSAHRLRARTRQRFGPAGSRHGDDGSRRLLPVHQRRPGDQQRLLRAGTGLVQRPYARQGRAQGHPDGRARRRAVLDRRRPPGPADVVDVHRHRQPGRGGRARGAGARVHRSRGKVAHDRARHRRTRRRILVHPQLQGDRRDERSRRRAFPAHRRGGGIRTARVRPPAGAEPATDDPEAPARRSPRDSR